MLYLRISYIISLLFLCASCYKETPVIISADFKVSVVNDDYSVPVEIEVENNTTGADHFLWTFEGGTPESSNQKQPGPIRYKTPGTYIIRMECRNNNYSETKEFTLRTDSVLITDFEITFDINSFAPARVLINNKTKGAKSFEWLFEGGTPATSTERNPIIIYDTPGEYQIVLKAGNGRENVESRKKIIVLPGLTTDFLIRPDLEDEDMQAPLSADLENKSEGALHFLWTATGGRIENDTACNTRIYFENPGEYIITLKANNEKEFQSVSHSIKVLPNTNIYEMKNVRLGINTSIEYGPFYSCGLRRTFLGKEINTENGPNIDFVFFGLNDRFQFCRFLSPDSVSDFVFNPIPEAQHTYVVNIIENTSIQLSTNDFDNIKNDALLKDLPIRMNDTGGQSLSMDNLPRLVLFETRDGRKGVIKIKKAVRNFTDSYIEADIKVQKKK